MSHTSSSLLEDPSALAQQQGDLQGRACPPRYCWRSQDEEMLMDQYQDLCMYVSVCVRVLVCMFQYVMYALLCVVYACGIGCVVRMKGQNRTGQKDDTIRTEINKQKQDHED